MEPNDDRNHQRLSPERAALWILGIVLIAAIVFVVAATVFN